MPMDFKTNEPIFFLCNDPERALGLEKIIKNFHIVCIDNSPIIISARKQGVKIFSLAEVEGVKNPIYRSTTQLLKNVRTHEYIQKNLEKGQKANIIVFKISLEIEKLCKEFDYKLLNTTAALNKKFELKISQYKSLSNLTSFFPKTIISTLNKTTYSNLRKKIGENIVIQYNRGHTGNTTIFINNEQGYAKERKKFPNRLARIAQYIDGEIYTINMCITRFGHVYGGLSYQITGIKGLTSKKGGTVGNDWLYPEKLRNNTINQIKELMARINESLYTSGYRGLLGIDIAITKRQRVYLIEINARQPASTSIHSKLMLMEELIPLQAFHIAEFLFTENSGYIRFLNTCFKKGLAEGNIEKYIIEQNKLALLPIEASQILIRNPLNKKKQLINNAKQGIYIRNKKDFIRTNRGYSVEDIIPNEYLLVTTQLGQFVSPESEIVRIQCLNTILDKDGELNKEIKEILNKIRHKIKIS